VNIYDLSLEELRLLLEEMGEPPFRAQQIWRWLYRSFASSFEVMTNLPVPLRHKMDAIADFNILKPASKVQSADKRTTKILFQLEDGNYLETVLMRYKRRRTLCISSQVGCAMGCVFCATGQMGYFRNLSPGEILAQVLYFARLLSETGERVTNIVVMGMGEPLHNYSNTIAALDKLTDHDGFDLGARKITISTVGLVPAMRRYADEQRQTPLAVSLHAATDEERNQLIPINRRWPLAELMEACRYYIARTGRRLTFEWALINGENDSPEQAARLGGLIKGMLCQVNLIPLNPTEGYLGQPSSSARVAAFQEELLRYGVRSTVRVRRGIDIQAGCGQLRDRVLRQSSQA
jgi:23S rRNA (adenine2503-C2)-methyltransferase